MSYPMEYPPPHMPTTQLSTPLYPQRTQPRPPAKRSRRESTSWHNGGGGGGGGTWRIQFEPWKCLAMAISRHRVDRPIPPVAFNGLNVAEVDTLKLLGVSFDRHLTWLWPTFVQHRSSRCTADWLPEPGRHSKCWTTKAGLPPTSTKVSFGRC